MYTYKRAVGINRLLPKGEELLDISAIKTNELFTQYENLVVVVTDELAHRDVAIDLITYQTELTLFDGYIQDWLTAKAAVQLVTSNKLPGVEYRFVTTHDIQYRWFSLLPGDVSKGDDQQDLLTTSQAKDIRVVKTDHTAVDYVALSERCLWTINGHMVRAVPGNKCLYLLNAGKHFNVNDNIHVNSLNFNTVSKLKTYEIKEEDIKFDDRESHHFLHYKSPVSLKGKTVWMSIGGRLYLNDVIQVRGDDSLTIRSDKVDWFSRIFDSKELIDLSKVIDKDRQVVGKEFFSTETFFKALLSDVSSFLIVLDNPHLYVSVKPLVTYRYPFTYHTEETRNIPLITGGGLLPKYFTRKVINRRLLDVDIGVQRRYVNETTGINNGGELYHGYTNRFAPSNLHQGYHLYIRGLIQEG